MEIGVVSLFPDLLRGALGHGLDLHGARALQEVGRLVVELEGEEAPPCRHDGAQEVGDLDQRFQEVDPRLLMIVKVGLAGVGSEADEFGALGGRNMSVVAGMGFGPEGVNPGLAIGLEPHGLKGEPG